MKKLLSVVVITFLMAAGLVATSSSPATAACPYSACIDTKTKVNAPRAIKWGQRLHVRVKVNAPGNIKPRGTINLRVTRHGRLVDTRSQAYTGGRLHMVTGRLIRKGWYKVTATFVPDTNSVFNGSSDKQRFKVKKRHRHHHR